MAEVFIDGVLYVPDPCRVTRMALYYMYDNHIFEPLRGTLEQILKTAKEAESRDHYGMVCDVILLNGDREIRRVGGYVHGRGSKGVENFETRLNAWSKEIVKDEAIRRLLDAEEISENTPRASK